MPHPFDQLSHDWGVLQKEPPSPESPTVPLPQEFALDSRIVASLIWLSRSEKGWYTPPIISVNPPRQISITGGHSRLPSYATYDVYFSATVDIPALGSTSELASRTEHLSLVSFVAEIGAEQDPVLGTVEYKYREILPDNTLSIKDHVGNNSDRLRSFWAIVLSPNELTPTSFVDAVPIEEDLRRLPVTNVTSTGFPLGNLRFYLQDANLVANTSYPLLGNSISILPICKIERRQNLIHRGYVWGSGGEEPLELGYSVIPSPPAQLNPHQRLLDLFAGKASTYQRTVQNLLAGTVAGNPGKEGEPATSPNGQNVAIANGERIFFTNQRRLSQNLIQHLTAQNDGSGNALVVATTTTIGASFSATRTDHRVYAPDGSEQSALGRFINLGGTGSLTWIAGPNSTIEVGQKVMFCPGIVYPAGNGFAIPFKEVERAWRGDLNVLTEIDPANLRISYENDLGGYEEPVNGDYFVVLGPERAGLQYIFKKIIVTANANGMVRVPEAERGCFAWIEGVNHEGAPDKTIDTPVYMGLEPNTSYKALIYYPPRQLEAWQFQFRYPPYQGTREGTWLNGAMVDGDAIGYIHTQGGGLRAYTGDALRYSPIAMHLPAVQGSIGSFEFDAPVQLVGESFTPATLRRFQFISGSGLAMPAPGQMLSFQQQGTIQARSLSGTLLADGQQVGFRMPALADGSPYQAVLAFVARKGMERRLVVVTKNGTGGDAIASTSQLTAFDTFRL